MVRGGKVSSKRKFRKWDRYNDKASDDSDEDYVVSDEENEVSDYSDEDYCSFVDGHASEESFGSFVEEEEEEEEEEGTRKRVKKVGRSKPKKRARRFIVEEEDEDEQEEEEEVGDEDRDEDEVEDEEMNEVKTTARSKVQRGFSRPQKNGVKPSQKRRVMYKEDEVDDDDDDEFTPNNDEEDEEFTPDDDDCSDEEESRAKKKKNNAKAGKRVLWKKGPAGGRKRKSMASKKPLRKKVRKTRGFRRKVRSDGDDDGDFMDNGLALREKGEMRRAWKRRLYTVPSDSDFASSGSSEYKYTISEEEREQVREAREYCGKLKTNLRSSSASNKIQEDVVLQPERKPTGRKGKEKVEEVKAEVVKQVCGICLSEEDKRKVRGTLNCCTHYFCFPCIMEWAKVESRCPLCKQRFNTISKPARNAAGIDLREMAIQVPERDQVYQPSEEELRSYIDPYENVICTECHEGGDDGLMLLCDLCDSPAHTYCVGLGREVPEGNWYCDGCRPVATGSSSSPAQTHLSDQRTTSSTVSDRASTVTNYFIEGLDLNSVYSQGFGSLSSPRYHFGGFQATSPLPGAGAPTLFGRRLIHRHIQQLLSVNRMGHMADRHEGNSGANLISDLNSPLDQGRETPRQRASTQEMGVVHAFFRERLCENLSTPVQDTDLFSPRISQVRRQMGGQDPLTASAGGPSNGSLWPGLVERSSPLNFEQQSRQCNSGPNNGRDRGETDLHTAKEQLHSMIKLHLKNLLRDSNLAQSTLMDIARSSTHTILAACELEHKSNEVVAVPVSPPPICGHIELLGGSKASLMRGRCSSCFDSFVGEVVKKILDTKLSERWLSLGL